MVYANYGELELKRPLLCSVLLEIVVKSLTLLGNWKQLFCPLYCFLMLSGGGTWMSTVLLCFLEICSDSSAFLVAFWAQGYWSCACHSFILPKWSEVYGRIEDSSVSLHSIICGAGILDYTWVNGTPNPWSYLRSAINASAWKGVLIIQESAKLLNQDGVMASSF